MKRTVSDKAARQRLGELLEGVSERGDEVIIERAGRPVGVLIPVERYRGIEQGRERLWGMIEEVWEQNQDADPEEIERDIELAIQEVRREQRAGHPDAGSERR
jgi:prevent-host-death family protein